MENNDFTSNVTEEPDTTASFVGFYSITPEEYEEQQKIWEEIHEKE